MTKSRAIFSTFIAALAVSGCIVIKNPFQNTDAVARAPTGAAGGWGEGRIARTRTGAAERDERELLGRAMETLAQTRRIGHAASLNRATHARVIFDYAYFDRDLAEMIDAIREYLKARDTGVRAARATRPLKLDYAR